MTRPADLLAATDALAAAARARCPAPRVVADHASEVLGRYDEVDARLVRAGFPPTSAWWRATFERWYRWRARQLVVRAGRRAGKSSSLSRLGVVEALYGAHAIPPGDVGVVAVISTTRPEAGERLRTIRAILEALGVRYRPADHGIELVDRPIAFRAHTATVAGVSGFTAVFVLCDEVAKWRDADTGANPATTVLASLRPTLASQPRARIVLSSSPLGTLDAHFDAYAVGETDFQTCVHAPTWTANPTITEAETHALEPDEQAWAREYAAVPQAEVESSLLTSALIERATRPAMGDVARLVGHHYVAAMDPATRANAWTLAIATRGPDGVRRVVAAREHRGSVSRPLSPRAVFADWKPLLESYGIVVVATDQWACDALADLAIEAGLALAPEPWTSTSKAEAYEALLKHAQDKLVEFPRDEAVREDLLGIRKKLTRNGVTYELAYQHGRHSDYAPAIAMAVGKASIAAEAERKPLSAVEAAEAEKRAFLEGRMAQRRREERHGALPPTHRRLR